jgi:transcriptional regulator with XRE-family HTH domain
MTTDRNGRPSARKMLAAQLARLREVAGWSLADLGERTTYDRTNLLRLEKGEKLGSIDAMMALDKAYGTGDHLKDLWLLAREDVVPNRYQRYMALEAEATVMQKYNGSTIPGLLQSKAYAEEQPRTGRPSSEEELAEQVAARMSRRQLLVGERPPHVRSLLDESVLRRPMRDPDAWREQLCQLTEDAQLPHVSIQVVPLSAGLHALLGGSLTLLWLPSGRAVAYA